MLIGSSAVIAKRSERNRLFLKGGCYIRWKIEKRFVFTRIMKEMTKKISALRSKIMWDNFFYGLNKIVKHVFLIRLQKFCAGIFPNFRNYTFLEADHGYAEVCTYLIVMQEIFKNIFINIFVYYLCDKIQKYFRNSFSVRYVLL